MARKYPTASQASQETRLRGDKIGVEDAVGKYLVFHREPIRRKSNYPNQNERGEYILVEAEVGEGQFKYFHTSSQSLMDDFDRISSYPFGGVIRKVKNQSGGREYLKLKDS